MNSLYTTTFLKLIAAAFLCLFILTPAYAQNITYDTNGITGTPATLPVTTVPATMTATDVVRVNLVPRNANNSFNSQNWTPNAPDGSTPSYLAWSVDVGPDVHEITSMDIGFRRSNRGPDTLELDVSVDGGATWITVFTETGFSNGTNHRTGVSGISAIDQSLIPTSSGIFLFRLRGSGSSNGSGTLRIRTFNGDAAINITAVPLGAIIDAEKEIFLLSQDGSSCLDLNVAAVSAGAVIPGSCIEYVIDISNSGSTPAEGFALFDALPGSLTFIAAQRAGWDETSPLPNPFTFSIPASGTDCSVNPCLVQVSNGIIPGGDTASIKIRATLN